MKKILLNLTYVILWCTFSFVQAQQTEIVISGTIFETGKNKKIVPYANIGIKGAAVGTVSNSNGEYEFHLPKKYINDSLQVSCLGYDNFSIAIKDIKSRQHFDIFLTAKAYELDAFTVHAQPLTAEYIVQEAIKRIPTNYQNKVNLMDGFYREYFEENDEFVAFAEASVSIYDPNGYDEGKETQKESVSINEIRVSDINNKGEYVLYIDINYALRSNVIRNLDYWQRHLKKGRYDVQKLSLDSISYYNNSLVYCISFLTQSKKRGTYEGNFYIRMNDFAVMRVEIEANNLQAEEINGSPHQSNVVLIYKEYEGKMYLNYISANHKTNYMLEEQMFELTFYSDLLINDITTKNIIPIAANSKMKEKSVFYQPRYRTFDPEFWATYNLFERSPANAMIIADLEKNRSLSEQYIANNKLKKMRR